MREWTSFVRQMKRDFRGPAFEKISERATGEYIDPWSMLHPMGTLQIEPGSLSNLISYLKYGGKCPFIGKAFAESTSLEDLKVVDDLISVSGGKLPESVVECQDVKKGVALSRKLLGLKRGSPPWEHLA